MPVDASNALLRWYVVDKRRLPWRAEPGTRPDPYRVWLSEVMLQQTRVAAALPYFERFTARWPTVRALAAAADEAVMQAWAGLGYYARARNLIACARAVVRDHGGRFPDTEAELVKLPGLGRYSAAAIAAIAFCRHAVVVDGNVERVVARLHAVEEPLPAARPLLRRLAASLTPPGPSGDFAQAMMDHGATLCTPRRPACPLCPLAAHCAGFASGDPASYPRKAPRGARPARTGTAYWLEHGGEVLLVRRPASGLLGGMLALPEDMPAEAAWQEAGSVSHVFTHFSLELRLLCAAAPRRIDGLWHPVRAIAEAGLPSLFAKAAARGAAWSAGRPAPGRSATAA